MTTTNPTTASSFSTTQLQKTQQALLASLVKMASGSQINQAADNGAGLVISDLLGSQAQGLGQTMRNLNDTLSITHIAGGALGQASDIVNSIRSDALAAGNASQSPASRQALQDEIQKSLKQLDSLTQTTTYNGQQLLAGGFTSQAPTAGTPSGSGQTLTLGSTSSGQLGDQILGNLASVNVTSDQGAQNAVAIADAALKQIGQMQSGVGAYKNQISATVVNLGTSQINTLASASAVRDLDLAQESANFSALESLNTAQVFAAAQANASKKNVLTLLQGA